MDTIRLCAIALVLCALSASQGFSQDGVEEAFDQLLASHQAITGENAELQRIELVSSWVQANDWRALPLSDQAWLYSSLSGGGRVDPNEFSVRWTGEIAAPNAGDYVFSQQFPQRSYCGTLKLWINETLVLDTTIARSRLGYGPELAEADESRFQSAPVRLEAGVAVPIRVEFVYRDEFSQIEDINRQWRFPLAVLLWRTGDEAPKLIAADTFSPPRGFGEAGDQGLKAEYFADAEFSRSVESFVEPGVQKIWNKTSIVPQHKSLQTQLLQTIRRSLLGGPGGLTGDELRAWVREGVTLTLPGLAATDRISLARTLAETPAALTEADIKTLAAWMPHLALLPESVAVDLLVVWSEGRDIPPAQIAPYVGYGPGSYAARNYGYRAAGIWMVGPAWPLAKELIDKHLDRPDGGCNLPLARLCSFSCRYNYSPEYIEKAIADRLADESLSADARASWLMAQGLAEELYIGGLPQPLLAMPSLTEALLIAEDPALRLHLFQDRIARLASCGKLDAARSFLKGDDEFDGEQYQSTIAELQRGMASIEEYIALQQGDASPSRLAAKEFRSATLRQRLEDATAQGREDVAEHYRQALEAEQSNSGGSN